jgi:RNA polymerase sigma factor (sigma-70 family)
MPDMPTDAELLRHYADERSEPAFAEIVQRYVDLVYSAALRQVHGDSHRAKDVAQVVFTTLARKASALVGHPVLAGWLYTATQHAAAKVVRAEWRRRALEQKAHVMQEIVGQDETYVDWECVRPVIDAAMSELTLRDREAVLLRFFAARPFREIGIALGVGEDAARMRVDRALDKLHALLAQRGVTSTSAALGVALSKHAVIAAPAGFAAQASGSAMTAAIAGFDLLVFMSTTKFTATIATAVVILATVTAVYQVREQRAAAAALTAAERGQAERVARLDAAGERVRVAEQALASVQQALETARATAESNAVAGGSGGTSTAPANDPIAKGVEFLGRFPNVRKALLDRSYARIRARFEPLYSEFQLNAEQVGQLENILLDGEGLTLSNPEFGALNLRPGVGRSRAEMEQAIRDLLGAERYQRLREHNNEMGLQQFTIQLASSLYFTDEPLTAHQARELGPVLMRNNLELRGDTFTRTWESLLDGARPLLSDGQFAALARLRAQEEFAVTMKRLMMK